MAEHNDFGKEAENLAAAFLQGKGYEILARNYYFQKAEIDIIAKFEDKIIIVEVKARNFKALVQPYEAVDKAKRQRLVLAANAFMKERDYTEEVRFDIISVTADNAGEIRLRHIESAFDATDV